MSNSDTTLDKVYRKTDGVIARHIAGELLLVPVSGRVADLQRIYSLDSVPAFIWDRLDGAKALDAIRDEIVAAYEVEPDSAAADLLAFVRELADSALVEPAAEAP
ncbi:MAG: hypothetical protein A3K19_20335 [Lentisphaerae bacterium RIFOXYB12_FULL_65_16]|nr:MAG: hypothetical protein A3K18_11350 [Lentisphaerae bacterium RIFOXYA12_64_32]OGV89360.1 MAG: hypothetical protein A3K19_20335 [Lentisphaerae bacterium RIFOXYB12_FULL_65_16]